MKRTNVSARNSSILSASPEDVFSVLEDPATYPEWLVGASRITDVDENWPELGSKFSHRIGFGPFVIPGSTSMRVLDRSSELVLGAGMGILGEAIVRFQLEAVPEGTKVTLEETLIRGAAKTAWGSCRLLVGTALWGRNAISLSSLEQLVLERRDKKSTRTQTEKRSAADGQPGPDAAGSKRAQSS